MNNQEFTMGAHGELWKSQQKEEGVKLTLNINGVSVSVEYDFLSNESAQDILKYIEKNSSDCLGALVEMARMTLQAKGKKNDQNQ